MIAVLPINIFEGVRDGDFYLPLQHIMGNLSLCQGLGLGKPPDE